jgi:glycosyltransferase involved in cell wall biosynthesis
MEYTPKISIITSVYNGKRYLEECIQSVLAQAYPNVEHIVIDGGSSDGTPEILRRYDNRLYYWTSEKDKGIYDAWNKGLAKATGEWIAFVGADDIIWDKYVIQDALDTLQQAARQHIRYVYGKVKVLSAGMDIIGEWGTPWEQARQGILHSMTVAHCCAFHHRSLFEDYGNFNEHFRIVGDYEFLLREFTKGKDAFFVDRVFAGMHAGGISANLRSKLILARENILARKLNGLSPAFHHRLQVGKAHLANLLSGIIGINRLKKLTDTYRSLTGREKMWSRTE